MITIIYTFHNRLEYNKIVFPQLLKEIKNADFLINDIFIYDDMSKDGSTEYIQKMLKDNNIKHNFYRKEYNSSVKQLQHTVENCKTKYIIKIDSDILIPDNYITTLYNVMEKTRKDVGFLAARETGDLPKIENNLTLEETRNIGGVGIFRRKVFNEKLYPFDRYYGFTKFQWSNLAKKYWITGMTNTVLDKSLAFSRVEEYTSLNWSRNVNGAKNYIRK